MAINIFYSRYYKQSRMFKYISFLFLVSILFSCGTEQKHQISFYYWKTEVNIGDTEKKYFNQLNSQRLYLRFFDVDSDKEGYASPKATIRLFDPSVLAAKYVPVIFITNRTFTLRGDRSNEILADNIHSLINKIIEKNNIPVIDEIQIDCDWTATTRDQYFDFLEELKTISNKTITSTLRLHQLRDTDVMGIPPADKVYLMCYATSSPADLDTENSILDMDLLKGYTKRIGKYPLPMDIALPIYSWGVVTNHRGEIKLINNVDISKVENLFKPIGSNTYEATEDFFLQGIYLNKGFTLRIEQISPSLLQEAKDYLDLKIGKAYNIVYYHLDKPFLEKYAIDELK